MKAKIPVILGLIFTIALAIGYGIINDQTTKYYDNNVNTAVYSDLVLLLPGQEITQEFTSKADRIDSVMLKCNNLGDYENTQITVEIYDRADGSLLTSGTTSGEGIKNRKLNKFSVDTITGCKGKDLLVRVTAEGSTESGGIVFQYEPADEYQGLTLNKESQMPGVLIFKTVCETFYVQSFIVMLFSLWLIWGFMWFLVRLFK